MEAAVDIRTPTRGEALLLQHCAAVGALDQPRATPLARLEALLGRELTRLLLFALVSRQGRRGSSSP